MRRLRTEERLANRKPEGRSREKARETSAGRNDGGNARISANCFRLLVLNPMSVWGGREWVTASVSLQPHESVGRAKMGNRVVGRSGTAAAAEDAATRRLRAEERLATGKAVAGKGAGDLGGRRNDG